MKKCCKCQEELDFEKFAKNRTRKDGFNDVCKNCHKKYRKQHYIKNKKKNISQAKIYRNNCTNYVNSLKKECQKCGDCDSRIVFVDNENKIIRIPYNCSINSVNSRIKNARIICQKCRRQEIGYFKLYEKVRDFKRKGVCTKDFVWQDVIKKFGKITKCYLTGKVINLNESKTYEFDHIIPVTKGGLSDLDNLGIACKEANRAKHNMLLEDFVKLCNNISDFMR